MIHILSHADADGYFASYAAQRFFRQQGINAKGFRLYDVQYNEPFPFKIEELNEDDQVFILDFSYSRELLEQIWARTKNLVVLDHHKTAQAELEGLPYAHFDMSKSGALLAWEHFFPNQEAPMPCLLVNDRDLWKWEYGETTMFFHAFIMTERFGSDFDHWHRVCVEDYYYKEALLNGRNYQYAESQMVSRFIENPKNLRFASGNFEGVGECHFCIYEGMGFLTSEVADSLFVNKPLHEEWRFQFTMEHRIRGDKMVFSLRSRPDFDVSRVAKAFGGGGHAQAAGFSMPVAFGFNFLSELYPKFLSHLDPKG